MNSIFASVNDFFGFIQPISDAVWNFPTQFAWSSQIPLLGAPLVHKLLEHYRHTDGGLFMSASIGIERQYWTEAQQDCTATLEPDQR